MSTETRKNDCAPVSGPNGTDVLSWSDTTIQIYEVTHVWIIRHYSFLAKKLMFEGFVGSSNFTATGNKKCEWILYFYPFGEWRGQNNEASVILKLHPVSEEQIVYAKVGILFLSEDQKENNRFVFNSTDIKEISKNYGFGIHVSKENLIKDGYLSNDELSIRCEITFSTVNPISTKFNELDSIYPSTSESSVIKDLEYLLQNGVLSDVILSANGKDYSAHKLILAARSPVFAAMFKQDHNTKENQQSRVDIADIDAETIEEMLYYIYTGKSKNLEALAEGLLVAAEKYHLNELKNMCEKELAKNLSVENAVRTLILGDLQGARELKSYTINFIVLNAPEVMKTSSWKNMSQSYLQLVVEICEAFSRRNN